MVFLGGVAVSYERGTPVHAECEHLPKCELWIIYRRVLQSDARGAVYGGVTKLEPAPSKGPAVAISQGHHDGPSERCGHYRGTSFVRNRRHLGPYSRTMLRAIWGS